MEGGFTVSVYIPYSHMEMTYEDFGLWFEIKQRLDKIMFPYSAIRGYDIHLIDRKSDTSNMRRYHNQVQLECDLMDKIRKEH